MVDHSVSCDTEKNFAITKLGGDLLLNVNNILSVIIPRKL